MIVPKMVSIIVPIIVPIIVSIIIPIIVSIIVSIHKTKNKTDCNNYRGVSVLCHFSKIFFYIMLM